MTPKWRSRAAEFRARMVLPLQQKGSTMEQRVQELMRTSSAIGEVCTGAYGYLSAIVDSYLNSPELGADTLRHEFHELQEEVTRAIERIMSTSGRSVADVVTDVKAQCRELGIPEAEHQRVISLALDFCMPGHRVTGM